MFRDPSDGCNLFIFLYLIQNLNYQRDPAAVDVGEFFNLEDDFARIQIKSLPESLFYNGFGIGGNISPDIHDRGVTLLLQFNVSVFLHLKPALS